MDQQDKARPRLLRIDGDDNRPAAGKKRPRGGKATFKTIQFQPVFVNTKNVRHFEVMMDCLAQGEGEGRMGMVYSRAGRGKTRTAQWYAAHNGCVYLRIENVWRSSELGFLQALCLELNIIKPPGKKGDCFRLAVDRLIDDPRPVFLDELEKLPKSFLETIRDLSDISTAPFIIIGEEEIVPYMQNNRRVWSRCYYKLEFEPIDTSDIIRYCFESTGLRLTSPVAAILGASSEGDFRLARRDLLALIQIANANQSTEITEEMAEIAVKTGLRN